MERPKTTKNHLHAKTTSNTSTATRKLIKFRDMDDYTWDQGE